MLILGLNAYHGDVSAALLRDGALVVAVEEERFRRIKHCAGVPTAAIEACLRTAGVRAADVDCFAIPRLPRAHPWPKLRFALGHLSAARLLGAYQRNAMRHADLAGTLDRALDLPSGHVAARLRHVEHHPAHLASAFYASGFDEATVCAIDGFGDFVSTSVAHGRETALDVRQRVFFPHSLGLLYLALTQYLGFTHYGDEYKVMGLAPYGKPRHVDRLSRLITLRPGGGFTLALRYFRHASEDVPMQWREGAPEVGRVWSPHLETLLGPSRRPDEPVTSFHEDVAASLQAVFEEAAFHILRGAHARVPHERLCLAGGCAMNSVANGRIRRHTPFRTIYVQPAAGDNGTALGAALAVWHDQMGRPRGWQMDHAAWGTSYDQEAIEEALALSGLLTSGAHDHQVFSDDTALCADVAGRLAGGAIVGWFQGRMEWGARALGSRSILADPRRADMREVINTKIKFRERFRPFAPSILAEAVDTYFEDAAADPFMAQVATVRAEVRGRIPAVTHVDGTGRLQAVSRHASPRYWELLKAFEARTGVPVLLNTSFNENEPIVEHPLQAIDCFQRTDMDVLVLGEHVIARRSGGAAG
jgi:carbamoyltransferase